MAPSQMLERIAYSALPFMLSIVVALFGSCATRQNPQFPAFEDPEASCDRSRLQRIEEQLSTSDGMGHGPDIGSAEWHSVIEFKLGVRGNETNPQHGTAAWCAFVESALDTRDA
ncbi:MAG: hypothetical protein ACR2PZ_27285 [Pseudomonadales bacterium]